MFKYVFMCLSLLFSSHISAYSEHKPTYESAFNLYNNGEIDKASGLFSKLKVNSKESAYAYFKKISNKKNDTDALLSLAAMHINAIGTTKNIQEGIKIYTSLTDDPRALFFLGLIEYNGLNGAVNYKKSLDYFNQSSSLKNYHASFYLGLQHLQGLGTKTNPFRAIPLLTKAAKNEILIAQKLLATIYFKGKIITKNNKRARQWFYRAALQGDKESMFYYGFFLVKGIGGDSDMDAGVYWLEKVEYENTHAKELLLETRGVDWRLFKQFNKPKFGNDILH